MLVSIITVTHNRLSKLKQKYQSLLNQSLTPEQFEWIVCANGEEESLEWLQSLAAPFKISHVSFQEQQAAAKARNACAALAEGKSLYFSDDDCVLEETTLMRHVAAQARPCVAIGSICFKAEDSSYWQAEKNYWNVNGANTSVPLTAFRAVGGFEERLIAYGGEDLLLGYLLKKQGLSFQALPDAVVTHLGPNPMRGKDLKKAESAGENAAIIAGYYPELAFRLGVHPVSMRLKRFALFGPVASLWRYINAESLQYERAYFKGATAYQDLKGEP